MSCTPAHSSVVVEVNIFPLPDLSIATSFRSGHVTKELHCLHLSQGVNYTDNSVGNVCKLPTYLIMFSVEWNVAVSVIKEVIWLTVRLLLRN